jgi:hypothetical protein
MPRIGSAQADGAVRPRYPVSPDTPRYRELAAALAVAGLLGHLLLAQLTLLLAVAMYLIGRASRWRFEWLAAPAGVGLLWTLAIGVPRAGSGLAAGPRHILGYLGGIGDHPGHLLTLPDAFSGLSHWLPAQFPLALILAAAEALGLSWLQRRLLGWPEWRTGLIVATRRWLTATWLRRGGVVSRDGAILGVDMATGHPASISWREAEGGVLVSGGPANGGSSLTQGGFPIAVAAVRRRKPVIVIDLTGSPSLAGALAAACREPGAPLAVFGPDGPGCYEPLRGGDPARAARMITAMVDWSGVSDQHRRSCAAYLADALAVQAAAPAGRRAPVLDDLIPLLTPQGLRERVALIPAYHPRRVVLADRAAVSASLLQADPVTTAAAAEQLGTLRASALGRWLRPATPDPVPAISLGRTVRERGVTLFSLDRAVYPDAARMTAGLAIADLIAVAGELEEMSVSGDSLVWLNGCEALGQAAPELISQLIAKGRAAGMSVVLSTTSATAAGTLAAGVSVMAADWPVDPALASRFADPPTGPEGNGSDAGIAGPAGAAGTGGSPAFGLGGSGWPELPARGDRAFALLARGEGGARPRVLAHCRAVQLSRRSVQDHERSVQHSELSGMRR